VGNTAGAEETGRSACLKHFNDVSRPGDFVSKSRPRNNGDSTLCNNCRKTQGRPGACMYTNNPLSRRRVSRISQSTH